MRSFIGVVNFYKSLFPKHVHLLALLMEMTGNSFSWNEEKEITLKQMKSIIATECINTYPDYGKRFHIYTNASEYKVRVAIIQEVKPLVYFRRKLSPAQMNYSTMEKELLAIVLCLKEYQKNIIQRNIYSLYQSSELNFQDAIYSAYSVLENLHG